MGAKSGEGVKLKKKIDISYVLPTYNRVEYLGECLYSLVEQEYDTSAYEIIVVDDGSTDSTPELVDFFRSTYPNVSYYKLAKLGVECARNFGNRKAKGDIIGVCDSDDLYHPDRTKITVAYFNKNKTVDIMDGSYTEINHQGRTIKEYTAIPFSKDDFLAHRIFYFCHDNCAYRKKVILKTPYNPKGPEGFTDDYKLVSDLIKAGYKFGYTKKELCKVRTLRNGIMGSIRAAKGVELAYA